MTGDDGGFGAQSGGLDSGNGGTGIPVVPALTGRTSVKVERKPPEGDGGGTSVPNKHLYVGNWYYQFGNLSREYHAVGVDGDRRQAPRTGGMA